MFRGILTATLAIAALVLSAPSAASASALGSTQYKVSVTITQDGTLLASPSLVVKPVTPGEVSVGGENDYRLVVIASPTDSEEVEVSVEVFTSRASVKSVLFAKPGKTVSVSTGDIALDLVVEPVGS